MSREPKSAYTPKQVADYLCEQITTRGEGGFKSAFSNQFFNHFESEELQAIGDSIELELEARSAREIEELRRILEEKSGKSVELK